MTTYRDLRSVVGRVLHDASGVTSFGHQADAVLAAISAAGLAIVPREATNAMLRAGATARYVGGEPLAVMLGAAIAAGEIKPEEGK